MVSLLYVVPNTYLRQFRRILSQQGRSALAITMSGLVAQILKEGLVSYREDEILEEIAIWQSVQDCADTLRFFAPIAQFTGFIQELRWLFEQIDHGEDIFVSMPEEGQAELRILYQRYHEILKQHGILNATQQLHRATNLARQTRVLPNVDAIILQGLGELSPLEKEFVSVLAQGRTLDVVWPQVEDTFVEVKQATDPIAEVEMIGKELRSQIEAGTPIEELAVAFPNLSQYLPILIPVFEKMNIPWRAPTTSLRNTPLGKTLLTLLTGAMEGWHKHHLELLVAPGWGFPFNLTGEEHRLLRLGPPLKGLPAWRNYLGKQPGWEKVLQLISEAEAELITRPMDEYASWLGGLIDQFEPELWVKPEVNLENWAELIKAWDGMQNIAHILKEFTWQVSPAQLIQILESLLDKYQIQARRVFSERVQIVNVEQLGAYTYQVLFVGGLVEGQFPRHTHAHWLTKTTQTMQSSELYNRLVGVAQRLFLYYPEVDRSGKLNLPATILPKESASPKTLEEDPVHHPTLFLGLGTIGDQELLRLLQEKILGSGLSVSQLNRYANCPYQFFCDYVLQLQHFEEESLELDARDHGNIVHNVLQGFWEKHLEGPLPMIGEAQAEVETLLTQAYLNEGTRPTASLVQAMRRFIRKDLQWAEKGFRPNHLEKWFQGVVIPTSHGPVEIRGRIDRIDLHVDGSYILYDYKTGSAPTISAMVEGKDVQIAAYLLASQTLLPQGHNVGVAYYLIGDSSRKGIFHDQYASVLGVRRGKGVLSEEEFEEQYVKFTKILQKLVEGILQGQFPIEPASSRICSFCPFQGICRKEVGFA